MKRSGAARGATLAFDVFERRAFLGHKKISATQATAWSTVDVPGAAAISPYVLIGYRTVFAARQTHCVLCFGARRMQEMVGGTANSTRLA